MVIFEDNIDRCIDIFDTIQKFEEADASAKSAKSGKLSKPENVQPQSKVELKRIIGETIEANGTNCDLNFIDTSKITDMSFLFDGSKFNGDISKWNVSNVTNMGNMFYDSEFNGNISKWNVSKVEYMNEMFAYSKFNGNISKWNVAKVTNMEEMFEKSEFDDIRILSKWCPHRDVKYQHDAFDYSPLNGLDFKCFR